VTTTAPLWADLVDGLAEQGVLSEQWRATFLAVHREVFIPEVIWRYAEDDLVALRRGDEPQEWLRRAYGPRYVVTQVDDGTPASPQGRGRIATSSASRPDIVTLMLNAGHIEPGMQAARARTALATADYGDVTVTTGDGAQGRPDRAPFDRVLSTVAAPRVPYAWVAQTRPGGLVLTPWGSAYKPAGLLSLTVRTDGTATGGLVNTNSDRASSGTKSPPPTNGGNAPGDLWSPSGASPSRQTGNRWS
jgi:protein-L-isoaspartate O-methyltransferase